VVGSKMDELSVETKHDGVRRVTHAPGARGDRVERGLDIRWRARNHPKDFGCARLLLERLRQALLKGADPGSSILWRLAGERSLGICLPLCRLCPETHQPLLASYSPAIDERLGEGSRVSKANGWVRTVPGSAREPLVIPAAAFTAGSGAIR